MVLMQNSGDGPIPKSFKEFAEKYRDPVYKTICSYVPIKEPLGHYKIMRDYIDRQGKYRRPALLLLTACLYGAKPEETLLPAAAQQLSEDWILMQDDIEDDSELRRGKPAAHRLYGWVHTLDASDTGHMAMWKMLKDYLMQVGPEKGTRMYDKFYDMMRYTVEGQYIENTFIHDTKDLDKASEELYFKIVDSKTCYYTIYGPMQLGAIAGGATDRDLEMLKEIGQKCGVAFQIVDDILDMIADEKDFGKKNNGDLYEGKLTLMVIHAYRSATPEEKLRMNAIYGKKRQEKTAEEIAFIRGLIEKYKSIDFAKGIADRYGSEAAAAVKRYIDSMPANGYREIVLSAIEEMYIRKK
ncbi:MAG TPA: polyprenyl synthetase family protein [Candidatus Acidoferrum sp.]|nr:polyprenyl synthetase family protein [Candidatus Acidoferrum sp.]